MGDPEVELGIYSSRADVRVRSCFFLFSAGSNGRVIGSYGFG